MSSDYCPTGQKNKKKKSKFLGMVRDALGGIGGSSLSIFTGFSKDFEKLKIQKLKVGRNRFKMGLKSVLKQVKIPLKII